MSLLDLIDATYKAPSAKVRINNNQLGDVLSVAVNSALESQIASATIRVINRPSINPENRVTIQQGYNGEHQTTFTGYVDTIEQNEGDGTYTITARDVLKKAMDTFLVQEVKFGFDPDTGTYYYSTFTGTDGGTFTVHAYPSLAELNANHPETSGNITNEGALAHAVVQWLLVMCGLAEGTEIQVDDTQFFIGDLGPAKFHLTSVYDACQQIANLIGWRLYADAVGVARFRKRPRNPGGYTYWSYTDKSDPKNIHKLSKTTSNMDLRNYVEVRGASGIKYTARASSPYLGSTPYRGVLISDELIDTPGIAEFVAQRVLGDLNRLKVTVAMEADGNPILTPGSTIDIRSNVANGKFLVEQIQTNTSADGGYKMNINAAQYQGDTVYDDDNNADIVAVFAPIFVASVGDPKIVVEFDGSASYSNRGIITNYTWEFPDNSVVSGASSTVWYVFDQDDITDPFSQDVTLTVTDNLGNVGSVTNQITMSGLLARNKLKYRHLYAALTTRVAGSVDGGATWVDAFIAGTSVAASNFGPGGVYVPSGHALFGTSLGEIFKTVDGCATMTMIRNIGGTVTDMHIPEMDSTKAYAVNDTGDVWFSDTAGDTWRQIGDFSFPLREVKAGFTDYKYVIVVGSGINNVYQTFDLGANWAQVTTDEDVLWATDGASTNYYAHTSGIVTGTGVQIAFSDSSPHAIPAATIMVDRDDGIMAVDSTGQHWVYSGGMMSPTQFSTDNKTSHMLRDGEMLPVVYYAVESGVGKSIDRNLTMAELYSPAGDLPEDGWGRKVAYGPLAYPVSSGRILYRGKMFYGTQDVSFDEGFWIHNGTKYIYAFADPDADATPVYAPGMMALAAGANTIHKIDILATPAGGETGFGEGSMGEPTPVPLKLEEDWFEGTPGDYTTVDGAWNLRAIGFYLRPGLEPILCWLGTNGPDLLNVNIWARRISDFKNDPYGTLTGALIVDSLTERDNGGMLRVSPDGNLIMWLAQGIFSPFAYWSVNFSNPTPVTNADRNGVVGTVVFDRFAPYAKFGGKWRGVVQREVPDNFSPPPLQTVQDYVEDWTMTTWPEDWDHDPGGNYETYWNMIYSSFYDPSRLYILKDFPDSSVCAFEGYGAGQAIKLMTLSAGQEFVNMTVIPNSDFTADIITVNVYSDATHRWVYPYYSTDSGQTWTQGPQIGIHGGDVGFSWFVGTEAEPALTT